MGDTCNAFSNHLSFKLKVEDATFCVNLQWSLSPHTQEKAHMQIMSYQHIKYKVIYQQTHTHTN